jgi:HEAT repeat protein
VIEHEVSGSGSAEHGGVSLPARRRSSRTLLVVLGLGLLLAALFWRAIGIVACFSVARFASSGATVSGSTRALARLGPEAIPALSRLADQPDLQHWFSAQEALALLRASDPEANAPIHDLLLSPSVRVRAAAACALVGSPDHDPAGLPVLLEELEGSDLDARTFAAVTLAGTNAAWFEKNVKDYKAVFEHLARVLQDLRFSARDPRSVFLRADGGLVALGPPDTPTPVMAFVSLAYARLLAPVQTTTDSLDGPRLDWDSNAQRKRLFFEPR